MQKPQCFKKLFSHLSSIHINRYILLIVYFGVFICSCPYYSWVRFSRYLLLGLKFDWLCPPLLSNDTKNFFNTRCREQRRLLHAGFSWVKGIDYSVSFFAAYCSYLYGPKIVISIGLIAAIVGWSVLSFAYNNIHMYTSFILIGFAGGAIYSPALNIINEFPEYGSISVGFLTAIGEPLSESTPFFLSCLIKSIGPGTRGFMVITISYICTILLPCLLGAAICVPSSPYKEQIELDDESVIGTSDALEESNQKSYFDKNTGNFSLRECFVTLKFHITAVSMSISSLLLVLFTNYFDTVFHGNNTILDVFSHLYTFFPMLGLPLSVLHYKGYSHFILLCSQLMALLSCFIFSFSLHTVLAYILIVLIMPFLALQEASLILYIQNNFRTIYLSNLSSALYLISGLTEIALAFTQDEFNLELNKLGVIIPLMILNIALLAVLAYLHKQTVYNKVEA